VFTPIYESGTDLAAREPVLIEAERLISSVEEPCRVLIGGAPNIYFSSLNATDRALTVPLTFTQLNSIYSVTGQAVPPETFASGTSGFAIPEVYFTGPDATLMGVWRFLGQEITVAHHPPVCSDRGIPGACEELDKALLRLPFTHTRLTVIRLTKAALGAAKSGQWKGSHGKYSVPFLARGARALKVMEILMKDTDGRRFICPVTPKSCIRHQVPKRALVAAFKKIFIGPVPRGLEQVSRRLKVELVLFEKMLKKLPQSYVSCP
jgi:hypothetical protein